MAGQHRNHLGSEKSPYLLQHKDNPVHWYPWGEEAFRAAREENKPIFLSIGYSTCYWCHVMEKDSFEIQEVADVLNHSFISIKVDREEHPDVDQIYMDAVMGITDRGGWPMSVFLTPDLKPFFGGTYFPRAQFLQILDQIQKMWAQEPKKISDSAETILAHLQRQGPESAAAVLDESTLHKGYQQLAQSFDTTYGGFGQAPKFPHSMSLSLLLRIHHRTGSEAALNMVTKSLDEMARGGMYDQLGGGFHRYSTDERWLVPHFEKMLYDNALLATTYLEAYQVTHQEPYAQVARETLDYVLRDMADHQGGFYSAEDAGEVGREGEFYVWTETELKKELSPEEFSVVQKIFGVTPQGNFEQATNILHILSNSLWREKDTAHFVKTRAKLLAARNRRNRPHKDDKILTAWNGLMIAALAKGYQVLGESRYLDAAKNGANFIQKKLCQKDRLLRRYRDGEARFAGTVNDYAFLIDGLLELYLSDFDPGWLDWAKKLQATQDQLFWDPQGGGYFYSEAADKNLLIRKKETYDGALPSGNSIAALNLLRLTNLTYDETLRTRSAELLVSLSGAITNYPAGYAQALIALDYQFDRAKEIAVIGERNDPNTKAIVRYLQQNFLPNQVIAVGPEGSTEPPLLRGKKMLQGQTTVYVCEQQTCLAPVNDLQKAKQLVSEFRKYKLK